MSTAGISFTRKVLRPALGTDMGQRKSIAVGFDKSDFFLISRMAQANKIGFQEQVRRLCKVAMQRIPQATEESP